MSEWFHVREVTDGIWLLGEPSQVSSYLVVGDECGAIVDTGLGIAPIRPVVEAITSLPLLVVNTHYHADHVGGNHEFDAIAIHAAGAAAIEREVPQQLLQEYMAYAQRMIAAGRAYRELDRKYFHLLNAESDPRPFPAGFEPRRWAIQPSRATRHLADGDELDLGGRTLTVLHTPGHSPDSISLVDDRAGVLLAGDAVATGPIYVHFPDSDLEQFTRSARRLADLASELRYVVVGHFGRCVAEPRLLIELADGCERVLAGEVEFEASYDLHLNPVRLARFPRCGITLPMTLVPSAEAT